MLYLKIGGSLITPKRSGTLRIDAAKVREIAGEVRGLLSDLGDIVLAHGAGSYGHVLVKEFGLQSGCAERSLELALVYASVSRLNAEVSSIMSEEGVPVMPIHPRSVFRRSGGSVLLDTWVIEAALSNGLLPLLHGDMILDSERGCYVLSADEIPVYLVPLGLKMAVFLTDVPGVLDEQGRVISEVRSIPESLGDERLDVTGSMHGKLRWALELAKLGVDVRIGGFENRGDLTRILNGEAGTRVRV